MFSHLGYQVMHVGRLMQPQTEESNDVREVMTSMKIIIMFTANIKWKMSHYCSNLI